MSTESKWWKNAIGYQIYPRSFYDSNGDGIGDLKGIMAKLPYIKNLGVDFIWLNPIYLSPNVDNGYDIAGYQEIQPEFGTLVDFKELLAEVHRLEMKLILDLVVNHTSDQHPWFLEAKKSKDNPYRDYYHWQDATENKLPNDWQSFFGGPTWTYDPATQQAYFHVFAPEQPDLNWKNPQVRAEIYQMIRWWLDLGIDGFRLDAISHIQKEDWDFKIKDNLWAPFMNVAGIETYMQELKELFAEYPIMTVGEASGVTSKKAVNWTNDEGYINMIFELEHNVRTGEAGQERLDLLCFKKVLSRWQKDLAKGGWNALYVENHDNPRINSVLGNETAKSAKALAGMFMLLQGTPFIYQGQELGMTNFPFKSIEQVDAKELKKQYQQMINAGVEPDRALNLITHWSRDHSRTPMQWDDGPNAGFTTGEPWLAINPNFSHINVADEEKEPASTLRFYQDLIAYRKAAAIFTAGSFTLLLKNDPQVFAYLRQTEDEQVIVLANLSEKSCTVDLPTRLLQFEWQLQLTNTKEKRLTKRFALAGYDLFIYQSYKSPA